MLGNVGMIIKSVLNRLMCCKLRAHNRFCFKNLGSFVTLKPR
jgi:hypothetical protein